MKRIIAILLCWLLTVNLGFLYFNGLFITKASADDETSDYSEKSIIVKLETSMETNFDTQDFPEVECSAVHILKKTIVDGTYCYTLILDISENCDVDEAISALSENSLVTSASTNHYKNNYEKDIYMRLSEETVYVSLGGKTELAIESYDSEVYTSSWRGIAFSVDPNVIDEDAFTEETFAQQGIWHFWPHIDVFGEEILIDRPSGLQATKSESHLYYGEVDLTSDVFYNYGYVKAADALSRLEGIKTVYIFDDLFIGGPGGAIDYYFEEIWQSNNTDIASVSTYGGTTSSSTGDVYNKTAVISGITEGETSVTVIRKGEYGWVKQVCKVCVFAPCDVNGDGICNNLDATAILKYDAGIDELPEESAGDFDLNDDGKVNNLDATMMLKYDAGLI